MENETRSNTLGMQRRGHKSSLVTANTWWFSPADFHTADWPLKLRVSADITSKFEYSRGNYQSLLLLIALVLLTRPFSSAAIKDREITCECTTADCHMRGTHTCTTNALCYSQLLEQKDGSALITKGCVLAGGNTLLCENQKPIVSGRRWPLLFCCKEDLCNKDVAPTPSPSLQYDENEEKEEEEEADSLRQKYDCSIPSPIDDGHGYDLQSIYFLVIVAALVIMIVVTAGVSFLLLNYRSLYILAPQDPIESQRKKKKRKQKSLKMLLPSIVTNHTTPKSLQSIYV